MGLDRRSHFQWGHLAGGEFHDTAPMSCVSILIRDTQKLLSSTQKVGQQILANISPVVVQVKNRSHFDDKSADLNNRANGVTEESGCRLDARGAGNRPAPGLTSTWNCSFLKNIPGQGLWCVRLCVTGTLAITPNKIIQGKRTVLHSPDDLPTPWTKVAPEVLLFLAGTDCITTQRESSSMSVFLQLGLSELNQEGGTGALTKAVFNSQDGHSEASKTEQIILHPVGAIGR